MFKTAKAKKRRFSAVLNVFKRFSNNSKTPPSKIEHKNEIARKTEDFLIFRAIFLTLQFSFTFPFLSHSTQNITHFRHFSPLPIQFYPFPPFSTFLRFPCQLTSVLNCVAIFFGLFLGFFFCLFLSVSVSYFNIRHHTIIHIPHC